MKKTFWTALCLAAAISLSFPVTATADIVSGRILGPDEKPIVNGAFTAKDSKGVSIPIKTDKTGNFSVYLDPGKFTVSYSGDATLTGTIESFPQARQADVHLKKAEGK